MSLMAGFDFIAEISPDTLLQLIKSNMKISGVAANPPFEFIISLSSGITGKAHVIVQNLSLGLNPDDTITLTLDFVQTSLISTAPLALVIAELDGNITIQAGLSLMPGVMSQEQLAIGLDTANVGLNFSAAAQARIALALPSLTAAVFIAQATSTLQNFVHGLGKQAFPLPFSVVPGKDGMVSPSLQCERLEVHCIGNQALAFFGILLAANDGNGDHTQKTTTAITPGNNVAISIAPGAFHSLIFCPKVASALSTDVAHLPTTCGSATGFATQGAVLTSLSDSFGNGHIDINASLERSLFCAEVHATLHVSVTLKASGTTLTPDQKVDPPRFSIDMPWYCYLAEAILGPIVFTITNIEDAIILSLADQLAQGVVNSFGGLGSTTIGAFSSAQFNNVSISPEGLTVNGTVQVILPHPITPVLNVSGSVVSESDIVVSTGTFMSTHCPAGTYPYTERAVSQVGYYLAIPTLLAEPLTFSWSLNSVPLMGSSGSVAFPTMTYYPMPLPGGTAFVQTVHVGYTIYGREIELTNIPGEGNFTAALDVTATDPASNVFNSGQMVQFTGETVDIGNHYSQDLTRCLAKLLNELREIATLPGPIPPWVPVNYPTPDQLASLIRAVAASGAPEADEILLGIKLAHGNSFYRTLFAQLPVQIVRTEKESPEI